MSAGRRCVVGAGKACSARSVQGHIRPHGRDQHTFAGPLRDLADRTVQQLRGEPRASRRSGDRGGAWASSNGSMKHDAVWRLACSQPTGVVFTTRSLRPRFLPAVSTTGSASRPLAGHGHGQNAKNRSPPRTLALWPRRRREANPTKKAPRCVHQRGFLVGPGGPVAPTARLELATRRLTAACSTN